MCKLNPNIAMPMMRVGNKWGNGKFWIREGYMNSHWLRLYANGLDAMKQHVLETVCDLESKAVNPYLTTGWLLSK